MKIIVIASDKYINLLNGYSEKKFVEAAKQNDQNLVTSMLSHFVTKVNDNFETNYIQSFIETMPAKDSKYIRDLYPIFHIICF